MNRVLYEVSYIGNIQNWLGIILSISIIAIVVHGIRKGSQTEKAKKITIAIIITMTIFMLSLYAIAVAAGCAGALIPYKKGRYVEIEGVIQDYSPNFGHTRGTIESFTLDGVKFECSDGAIWGYCPNRENGGVITGNGQHLRIRYIPGKPRNTIVYIEQMMPEEW